MRGRERGRGRERDRDAETGRERYATRERERGIEGDNEQHTGREGKGQRETLLLGERETLWGGRDSLWVVKTLWRERKTLLGGCVVGWMD